MHAGTSPCGAVHQAVVGGGGGGGAEMGSPGDGAPARARWPRTVKQPAREGLRGDALTPRARLQGSTELTRKLCSGRATPSESGRGAELAARKWWLHCARATHIHGAYWVGCCRALSCACPHILFRNTTLGGCGGSRGYRALMKASDLSVFTARLALLALILLDAACTGVFFANSCLFMWCVHLARRLGPWMPFVFVCHFLFCVRVCLR